MSRLTLAALILEAAVGYPEALDRRLPHPVNALGAAISGLERRWNRPEYGEARKRAAGVATMALVGGGAALAGAMIQGALSARPKPPQGAAPLTAGFALASLIATTGLAQRSLYDHAAAVLAPLERGDLAAAREAVGRIVGRDVDTLDASRVAAAALESLAESFNDGVVAPAFWLAAGGLPGLFAYKAVNTADSLIGHKEPRWRSFGWAAARTDDVMNLAPARLTGALIAAAAGGKGWRVMIKDARKHASPNAGWPEAAMAGALGVRLGGAARYDGEWVERPTFGDGPAPGADNIKRGLNLYVRTCGLLWLLAGAAACRR
ncbi:MAG: cobalamin biosynthesis protein CobD [Caulobacteraceae bacterium]|nr:cobalamin biosynthesis protein CobD [Caulobacteraceae bacterium]